MICACHFMTYSFCVEAMAIALRDICSTFRTCASLYSPEVTVTYI